MGREVFACLVSSEYVHAFSMQGFSRNIFEFTRYYFFICSYFLEYPVDTVINKMSK